jgi:hypothetical protein
MKKRTRFYVLLLVGAALGSVYGKISDGWNFVEFYAGLASIVTLAGLIGLTWIEFAPDGAFRRKPRA